MLAPSVRYAQYKSAVAYCQNVLGSTAFVWNGKKLRFERQRCRLHCHVLCGLYLNTFYSLSLSNLGVLRREPNEIETGSVDPFS